MNRFNPKRKPAPDMIWSRRHRMWLDPDTRTPRQKARDEAIARRAERERPQFLARVKRVRSREGGRRARGVELTALVVLDELVAERRKAGLTQKTVARRMGVPQSVVARLESGSHSPTLTTLARYAEAVGCRLMVGEAV